MNIHELFLTFVMPTKGNTRYPYILTCVTGAIMVVSVGAMFFALDRVPGIHFDEALVFFRAEAMDQGTWPLGGKKDYIGDLYDYVFLNIFSLAGYDLWLLRFCNVVSYLVAVWFAFLVGHEIGFNRIEKLFLLLTLVTLPAFFCFSRIAFEVTALSPMLFFAGTYLAVFSWKRSRERFLICMCISLLTGFLFAAGVYNHFLFLVPVGALCFAALVSVGWPLLRSSAIWISGVGFIASVLLFRYAIFPRPDAHQGKGAEERIERIFSFKFLDDFPNAIRIFGNVLDGKLLYQRFCGEVLVEVIPYASTVLLLLVVVSFILPFGADYADYRKRNRVIAIFGIVLFLGLVVVLPALSLRYFLLSSLVFPFLLVSVLSPMLRSEANRQFYISSLFILSISLCNVAYLSVNYFYAFGKSGGRTSEFRLGNRLTETSDHFVATDNLYATLKAKNVEHLVAKIGIVVPILAYDYNTKAIRDVTITHNRKTPSLPDDRDPGIVTAIVKYRKGNGSPFDIEIYGADSKR